MIDEKKFCFIICANKKYFLDECLFYISLLEVPAGYTVDVISIEDAKSMTAGYNEGMAASDARYKIYLHQDVFILYKGFLQSVLDIFDSDSTIGMIGVVGAPQMSAGGVMWHSIREGQLHGAQPVQVPYIEYKYQLSDGLHEVQAVDGLLMVTCQDIPWREDIFDGWDFYDVSQSFEFLRRGYRVVVPEQKSPWCLHDSDNINSVHYNHYRALCLNEYKDFFGDRAEEKTKEEVRLRNLALFKEEKNRKLGMRPHVCHICGAEGMFQSYLVREMMQNTRDEFEYFVCDECKCLQIAEIPEDLGRYYGQNYYSFSLKESENYQFKGPVNHTERILDVGCGSGAWLFQLANKGWGNLYGCDPFLEKELHYGDRVHIRNCTIHDLEEDEFFDEIYMSDSFEHMTDPLEALKSAHRLLKPGATLRMDIPTWPNIAFDMFETHWYQLDAPRHIFLHSRESLEYLGRNADMKIVDMKYNSDFGQIVRSYFYQRGVPFWEQSAELVHAYFSEEQLSRLSKLARQCNQNGTGDHVRVVWERV